MKSRDFAYWLQGYFELAPAGPLSAEQAECIKRHLALVFVHEIDPSAGPPEHQAKLDAVHSPPKTPPPTIGGVDPATGVMYRC